MEVGRCNLGFPYTFSESLGSTEHCYVFGFLGTRQSLSCQTFKDAVDVRLVSSTLLQLGNTSRQFISVPTPDRWRSMVQGANDLRVDTWDRGCATFELLIAHLGQHGQSDFVIQI